MSDVVPARRDASGRPTGRRGQLTRQRLLDATQDLLDAAAYRDLKVVDVARAAGTSPATFYQYFPDAESAVLELAQVMAARSGQMLESLVRDADWDGDRQAASAVAAGFLDVWADHGSLIGVIDLAAAEGEPRFRQIRTDLLNRPTEAFADVIGARVESGRLPPDVEPIATAGVLVSMLAHVASHHRGLVDWGAADADLRHTLARIVDWSVTGRDATP
jgi:AcrR family transcriptional regulator